MTPIFFHYYYYYYYYYYLMQVFFIEQTRQITSYKLSYCARRKSGIT